MLARPIAGLMKRVKLTLCDATGGHDAPFDGVGSFRRHGVGCGFE